MNLFEKYLRGRTASVLAYLIPIALSSQAFGNLTEKSSSGLYECHGSLAVFGKYIDTCLVSTLAAKDWYVNSSTGSDSLGDGTTTNPFKTIQRCIDEIPPVIKHKQHIYLSDGVYNESSRSPGEMPRPAVVYLNEHWVSGRTDIPGGVMDGYLVLIGESEEGTIIQTSNDYVYGIYSSHNEIGLQNLSIKAGSSATQALCTTHRSGSYVHADHVSFLGENLSRFGIIAEAGGWAELVNCTLKESVVHNVLVYAGSAINLAGESLVGGSNGAYGILATGYLQINAGTSVSSKVYIANGGVLTAQGASSNFVSLAQIDLSNASMNATYTNISGAIISYNSNIVFTASNWSSTFKLNGGLLRLGGAKSFIAPETASSVADPLTVSNGGVVQKDATTQIVRVGGVISAEKYNYVTNAINANSVAIPLTLVGGQSSSIVLTSVASRSGCTLGAVYGVFNNTPPPDGYLLTVTNVSADIELIEGSSSIIGTGGKVILGVANGESTSITFQWLSSIGKWVEISRSSPR